MEGVAIRVKSDILIRRLQAVLEQLDGWLFPTKSSERARTLLLETLNVIQNPSVFASADPTVLHNRLFWIEKLVESIERSATDRISWPLVSHCDAIWKKLFPNNPDSISYSAVSEHNYTIFNFTRQLSFILAGLLPRERIAQVVGADPLYCLGLAAAEGENSPLYANIGHEFGHAVYDQMEEDLETVFVGETEGAFGKVVQSLLKLGAGPRIFRRTARCFRGIGQELFCDMIGAVLMGPAFLLSLHEIAWGQDKNAWRIRLMPSDLHVVAYPSFRFRLELLLSCPDVAEVREAGRHLPEIRARLERIFSGVELEPGVERVIVTPDADPDAAAIQSALGEVIPDLRSGMSAFISRAREMFVRRYELETPWVDVREIATLLRRLDHQVVPNIVEDDSLLGKPPRFTTLLNAAAFCRLDVMLTKKVFGDDGAARNLDVVERLSAKALETTFIQRDYRDWRSSLGDTE